MLSSSSCLCRAGDGGDSDTLQPIVPNAPQLSAANLLGTGRSYTWGILLVLQGAQDGLRVPFLQGINHSRGQISAQWGHRGTWLRGWQGWRMAMQMPEAEDLAVASARLHLAGCLMLFLSNCYTFPLAAYLPQLTCQINCFEHQRHE